MSFMIWGTLFVLSVLEPGVAAAVGTSTDTRKELSPREIYEQTASAVVMVMGHSDGGKSGSGGTGSIIQADGTVLTNAHVVIEERTGKPYPRLSVFLKPARVTGDSKVDLSRMFRARVVAYSQPLDLALLKLEGVTDPLPVVTVSESGRSRIGDHVVAIGHPEQGGLWTLTTGVISAEVDNFNGVKGKDHQANAASRCRSFPFFLQPLFESPAPADRHFQRHIFGRGQSNVRDKKPAGIAHLWGQ